MTQIIVIDLGSQLSHLIARRVRELNVFSEVYPNTVPYDTVKKMKGLKGIILSGGPSSIYEDSSPEIDYRILKLGIPVLGICYGHQLIARHVGGEVEGGAKKEYGITDYYIARDSPLFHELPREQKVWMNHGDIVRNMPEGFHITGRTENSPVASFENDSGTIFGVQFHTEVTHTDHGFQMMNNFIYRVCKAESDWNMDNFVDEKIKEIKKRIGKEKAIIGLSGGVDSSTCAALVTKAIGKNLTAIFIDTGFMRLDEPDEIRSAVSSWDLELKIIDSKKVFFEGLKGVSDPEEKRKIIGELFIREFEREAREIDAKYLVQGTIYPDIIESGSTDNSSTIKSHHNVGGLPEDMDLLLCEPLRDLYKDEVRQVAKNIGVPFNLIRRHPFPGPGLAIRIIGECTPERVSIVQKANYILHDELVNNNYYDETWQAFAVLLPINTVGVQGDARSYKQVIALRMVDSVDAMTANFTKVPHNLLEKISTRITNEIPHIGRVVFDITNKPPGTIEWE